jgi:hypothetical protein
MLCKWYTPPPPDFVPFFARILNHAKNRKGKTMELLGFLGFGAILLVAAVLLSNLLKGAKPNNSGYSGAGEDVSYLDW